MNNRLLAGKHGILEFREGIGILEIPEYSRKPWP